MPADSLSFGEGRGEVFFKPAPVSISGLQRKCKDCGDEEKLHRKESSSQAIEAGGELTSYINSLSSKGSPLPDSSRSFFEPRFGPDFSGVKIHNDADAAKSSQSVNALAYTVGNNIVFNQNQFSPDNDGGKKLLAHELTHVAQQTSGISSIQKKDDKSVDQNNTNGWENDMESFSKVATEHYLMFDRNLLSDSVQTIQCSADTQITRECTVTTKNGIKITVHWDTETNRVVVKSCINDDCLACGYTYSIDGKSNLIFEKIKCWIYAK
jgi:hypothetical protein